MSIKSEKLALPRYTLPAGTWSKKLWMFSEDIIRQIFDHPFCQELAEGTLPGNVFRHYLGQDLLYIEKDARAFLLTAEKATKEEHKKFLRGMADDGVEIERILHRELFPKFHATRPEKMSPVCHDYTQFLLYQATNHSFETAISALLPCFWVYHENGMRIREKLLQPNPYQIWIDTYSGREYMNYVRQFVHIVDQVLHKSHPTVRQKMFKAFRTSTSYELAFFDESLSAGKYKKS